MDGRETTDDAISVQAFRRGDTAAFTTIVHRYRERLYGLLYGMLGSHDAADDALQETFVKAYRKMDSFLGRAKFYTWLYRIAVNTARDHRKHERRRLRHVTSAQADIAESDTMNEQSELRADIEDMLSSLPEAQRLTLLLVARDGLSHREAARIQGCSEGTVSWRIHEARKTLRGRMHGTI
ncbi:MAG: sigma-70 family RNA polymerase sigma factor [Spirochaetota bacterium]